MTKNMTMIMNMKSGLVFAALALVAAGCGKTLNMTHAVRLTPLR